MKDYLNEYYIKYLKSKKDFDSFCVHYHLDKKIFLNYINQNNYNLNKHDIELKKLMKKCSEHKRQLIYYESKIKEYKLRIKDIERKQKAISKSLDTYNILKSEGNTDNYNPKTLKHDIQANAKQIKQIREYISEENKIEHCMEIKYYN